jgi:hypothetical protein
VNKFRKSLDKKEKSLYNNSWHTKLNKAFLFKHNA